MSTLRIHYDADAHARFVVTLCGTGHGERRGSQSVIYTRTKKRVTCLLCKRSLAKQDRAAKLHAEIQRELLRLRRRKK